MHYPPFIVIPAKAESIVDLEPGFGH